MNNQPNFHGHPDQRFGHVSFAQHGDDFMILNLFELIGIERPSYLDIGAHHPFVISNTALLYSRGSRGVNVEANLNLIKAFKTHRPEDKNICIGVAAESGVYEFNMYSETSGRNTFSKDEVKSLDGVLKVKQSTKLLCVTIGDILRDHCAGKWPDFLSMDIEGFDYDVLKSADFSKDAPKVVCVEVRKHDVEKFRYMMADKGYFLYCRMGENLFFVRNDYHDTVWCIK